MLNTHNYLAGKYIPRRFHGPLESVAKTVFTFPAQVKNRLSSKGFYCKALNGESAYNICVNSDMTVSCNCSDFDGSGHIGNLREQSLKEIFDGKTARTFREKLAKGLFAIPKCAGCSELATVDRKDAVNRVESYDLPSRGIMVENTVNCNLKCTFCDRAKIYSTRGSRFMSLEDMEKVATTIRDYNIEEVSYFNLGEPFFTNRILEELRIIRHHAPQVRLKVSTNGALLDNDVKREAALMLDHVSFSIDGSSQEKVVKYQVGAEFERSGVSIEMCKRRFLVN